MESVILDLSSFIDLKIYSKLNVPFLTANSLYSEVCLAEYPYE